MAQKRTPGLAAFDGSLMTVAQLRAVGRTRAEIDALPAPDGIKGVRVVDERESPDERLKRIHAALAVAPADGVLSGWAAAVLHGVPQDFLDGTLDGTVRRPVEFSVPRASGISERDGLKLHWSAVAAEHRHIVEGYAVTSPARTAIDLARWAKHPARRLAMIDLALRHGFVSKAELTRLAHALKGFHGLPAVRALVVEGSCRAESVPESELRYLWLEAGLPQPLVNRVVLDRRGFVVGRPDLMDEESGLVGEYQGFWHLIDGRPEQDAQRSTKFRRMNLTIEEFWKCDVGGDTGQVAARLRAARARGLARDRRLDAWELAPQVTCICGCSGG